MPPVPSPGIADKYSSALAENLPALLGRHTFGLDPNGGLGRLLLLPTVLGLGRASARRAPLRRLECSTPPGAAAGAHALAGVQAAAFAAFGFRLECFPLNA